MTLAYLGCQMGSFVLKQVMLAKPNGFTLNKRKHLIENLNSIIMFIFRAYQSSSPGLSTTVNQCSRVD
jgi:hypothetical protein